MKKILNSFFLFISFNLSAQENLNNLYIKCDRCDNSFLKNEIKYINHVREQGLADIQLFIYRNRNANNGSRYSLDFIGKNKFSGKDLSLVLDTNPKFTRDEVRNALKRKIDIGLLYFLIESDISNKIKISYDSIIDNSKSYESNSDKWRNWVFQTSGEANFESETSRKQSNIEVAFDADKVTDKIKLQIDLDFERSNNEYENDNNVFISNRNRKKLNIKKEHFMIFVLNNVV